MSTPIEHRSSTGGDYVEPVLHLSFTYSEYRNAQCLSHHRRRFARCQFRSEACQTCSRNCRGHRAGCAMKRQPLLTTLAVLVVSIAVFVAIYRGDHASEYLANFDPPAWMYMANTTAEFRSVLKRMDIQQLQSSFNGMFYSAFNYANDPNRVSLGLAKKGLAAKYPVVIIPGFVTSGLELWQGLDCFKGGTLHGFLLYETEGHCSRVTAACKGCRRHSIMHIQFRSYHTLLRVQMQSCLFQAISELACGPSIQWPACSYPIASAG